MQKEIRRKGFVCGIIILLVGGSLIPSITGSRHESTNAAVPKSTPCLAEETIIDWAEDICTIDVYTGNISIVTENPYVEVDNIDIISGMCKQDEGQITVSLQVAGRIENRGGWPDPDNFTELIDLIEYDFQVTTSEQEYWVSYVNNTGFLEQGNETINLTSSNFTVDDDTLSMTFSLMNAEELYEGFLIQTAYLRANLTDPYSVDILYLFDMAPNLPLTKMMFIGRIQNTTKRQDYITFNPVHMKTIRFMPFNISASSNDLIVISKKYVGYVGNRIIIGLFNVADMFFQGTTSYSLYQRLITTYSHRQ